MLKPELDILREMNKKLERVETNQYFILSRLIPETKPTKIERKIIREAILKEGKLVGEKELLEALRK